MIAANLQAKFQVQSAKYHKLTSTSETLQSLIENLDSKNSSKKLSSQNWKTLVLITEKRCDEELTLQQLHGAYHLRHDGPLTRVCPNQSCIV